MKTPSSRTVFERVWQDSPDEHLFISRKHGVMAVVDIHPKLPLQVVVAPRLGTPGREAHLAAMPLRDQLKLWTVAQGVGRKILNHCEPGQQRLMEHVEGYNVTDHPHIVLAAVRKDEGGVMYDKNAPILGDEEVARTLELIRFTPEEAAVVELQLDDVDLLRQV